MNDSRKSEIENCDSEPACKQKEFNNSNHEN